jgi:hypothetical protein
MANHVHFHIEFHQINDAAKEKLQEMGKRIRTDGSYRWFSDMFVEGDLTYEQAEKYEWTCDNIGPKWSYFEDYDFDSDNPYMNGEAAWSAPEQGLTKLLGILAKLDPNMITSITYEDEMPNFIGASVYEGEWMYDGFEDDWSELRERVISASEILTEDSWNADDEEWADEESESQFQDEMWEVIGDAQWSLIRECVENIKLSQSEIDE